MEEQAIYFKNDLSFSRKETLVTPSTLGGSEVGYMQQYPVQINVGGSTIFVIDVDQFVKI